MESIIYQQAEIRDFLEIAGLDREAWKLNRQSEFIPDGEHSWRIWIEHGLVYVAKSGRQIVGAILAFPCRSGSWCLHKVFIAVQFRGKGLGSKLFEVLLAELDNLNVPCFLTVDPANDVALKLYEKWGFTEKRFVAGFYRANEDRHVLTRPPQKRQG